MEIEKLSKYQGGKIYTIRSPHTDKYYIGSTIEKYLSSRLNGHNSCYKKFLNGIYGNLSSFEIIQLGNAYIELLELFPCNSKLELHKREGEMIREHKLNCVNKNIAGRTLKQYYKDNDKKLKENNKQYYEENKDKMNITKKQYYETNKVIIKEKAKLYLEDNKEAIHKRKKQYYENNKDVIKEKDKQKYEKHKDVILEKQKVKYVCECGTESTIAHKSRHNTSIKHQNYLNSIK